MNAPHAVKERQSVLVGPPASHPERLIDGFVALLAQRPNVTAGYVAQLFLPSLTQRPRLVVGIEAVGDFEELRRDAAVVVENAVAYGETVFVTQLVPGTGGLSDYFLANRAPFYRRSGASAGDRLPRQR